LTTKDHRWFALAVASFPNPVIPEKSWASSYTRVVAGLAAGQKNHPTSTLSGYLRLNSKWT